MKKRISQWIKYCKLFERMFFISIKTFLIRKTSNEIYNTYSNEIIAYTRIFKHAILSYPRLNLKARNFVVKSIFYFLHSLRGKLTVREIHFSTSTHKYSFSSDSELNEVRHNLRLITVQPLKHWKLFMWDKASSHWQTKQNSKVWLFVAEPFRHLSLSRACIPFALTFSNFNFLDISQQTQADVDKDKITSWLFFSCH